VQLKIRRRWVFRCRQPIKPTRYHGPPAAAVPGDGDVVLVPGEFPVKVREVVKNDRIVLEWESTEKGYDTSVEMIFKPLEGKATMVQIRESGWHDTPKGIESSYGNCGGWMNMLCCFKAFLEYGINLRAGGAL
jgi:uncharacterized protein YndB with AHSA1/START domain